MSYYSRKIKEIREKLEGNIYPPKYVSKKWKHCTNANCYAYALDIPVNDSQQIIWIPGCISNEEEEPVIFTDLLERLKRDLKFL